MTDKTGDDKLTSNVVTVAEGILDTPEKWADFHDFLAQAGRVARDKYAQARRDTEDAVWAGRRIG